MVEVSGFLIGLFVGFLVGLPAAFAYLLFKFNRMVANAQVEATGFISRKLTKYLQDAAMKHVRERAATVAARSTNVQG